jgi:hypothetical protein
LVLFPLFCAGLGCKDFRDPVIVISREKIVKSNYDFIPEHWKEAKLKELREAEKFKDLPAKDQFDYYLKLCDWTHRQWKSSNPDPYPLCNAIDILADIRSGKTGGFCGQYSYVLADAMKSMGYFAVRYVELWSGEKNEAHFVVEAWSDQHGKWVVLDPHQDIYYEFKADRTPANAHEIRESFLNKDNKVVARSAGDSRAEAGDLNMRYYANFAVSMRSDLMRHPRPLTVQDRFDMFVFFRDQRTRPQIYNNTIPYSQVTSRIEDIYFDCNCVRAEHRIDRKKNQVDFNFFTDGSAINFKGFAVSLDQGQKWMPVSGNQYSRPISRGPQTILVAPLSMADMLGTPTRIDINPAGKDHN